MISDYAYEQEQLEDTDTYQKDEYESYKEDEINSLNS